MRYLLILGLLVVPAVVAAQESHPPVTIADSEVHRLRSTSVGDEFELHVAFPPGVTRGESADLPVLFVLDSNEDFPLVTTLVRRFQDAGDLPQLLIVGIGYPEYPRYYRSRDYTPTDSERTDRPSGGAADFLAFLQGELIPYLREEFSVSDRRVILGHSLGGLFLLYALRTDPGLFSAAVISSPAAWWDEDTILTDWPFDRNAERPVVYTSLGGEETELMTSSWNRFADLFEENWGAEAFRSDLIPGESHGGVKFIGYSRGLRWVWSRLSARDAF